MPQNKSKMFRVAVAGPTADGREIKEQWLRDIANTYSTQTYTASIFPEHIRGFFPGSMFSSQGIVESVELGDADINGEKRVALYASIKPNPSLVEITRRGEKMFSSIEVNPNFANTGKAYLVAMAITDEPASLGTEQLQFAANHFSVQVSDSLETVIEFEDEPAAEKENKFSKALGTLRAGIERLSKTSGRNTEQVAELAQEMGAFANVVEAEFKTRDEQYNSQQQAVDSLKQEVQALKEQYKVLDNTPKFTTTTPPATGGAGLMVQADC